MKKIYLSILITYMVLILGCNSTSSNVDPKLIVQNLCEIMKEKNESSPPIGLYSIKLSECNLDEKQGYKISWVEGEALVSELYSATGVFIESCSCGDIIIPDEPSCVTEKGKECKETSDCTPIKC